MLHRASRDDALTRERERDNSSRGTRGSRDSTLALPGRERDVRERMKERVGESERERVRKGVRKTERGSIQRMQTQKHTHSA